ncbi:MAG: hypothetical protein CR974_00810 [Gammaproteobacteria bacterium]|nr:MAG: hypothetical protein CR974_00810 [Gammaproteobacteria bacterium]
MKTPKERRFRPWLIVIIGLLVLVVAVIGLTPFALVNRAMPAKWQLLSPSGNAWRGEWQNVSGYGKRYPLHCRYRWQRMDWQSVTYRLNCETPLAVSAEVRLEKNGDITVTGASIHGELQQAQDWLYLSGLRLPVHAPVDIAIKQVTITAGRLTYLDIAGTSPQVCLFAAPDDKGSLCASDIEMRTTVPALSATQAMTIHYDNPKASEGVQVDANTWIGAQEYVTYMEFSGTPLAQYAGMLSMVGQKLGDNRYGIQLVGRMQ